MNAIVQTLNTAGQAFVGFAVPMLLQSSLLILILLAVDAVLRKRVRAVFRYWIWMLVLVKLMLPPSLWSPVSVGTWLGETLEVPAAALLEPPLLSPEEQGQDALATGLSPAVADFLPGPPPMTVAPPLPEPGGPAAPDWGPTTPEGGGATRLVTHPPALSLNWQGFVLLVSASVVAALLLLLAQRTFFVRGLVAQADEASQAMRNELDQCRQRLGLRQHVSVRLSPHAAGPAVCGLWRPVILIPQNLAARLHGTELQAVLFHELAHIKRGDLWINLLQTLLQILYFYHPLLWLANAVIRRLREKAVDEMVLVALGEAAPQYPDTLIHVAKLALARRPALSLRLIGVVESRNALTSRIQHILNRPLPKTARLGLLGLLVVFVLAAVLLPMAKGQRPPESLDTIASEEESQALRYSFPDLAIEASHPNLPGAFLLEYRAARTALDDAQGAPTESRRAESRRTFEALSRQAGAFPINLYAQRWVILLDWLSGEINAVEAAQRMNALAKGQDNVAQSNFTKAYAAIILARDGDLDAAHDVFVGCSPSETPQWGWFAFEMDKYLNRHVEACAPNVNQVVDGKIMQTARTREQWQAIETELRAAQTAYADYLEYEFLPLAATAITSQRAHPHGETVRLQIMDALRYLLVGHTHCFSLGATTHAIETRFRQQIAPKILAAWYQSLELFDKKQQAAEIEGHLQEIKARWAKLDLPWDSLPLWRQRIQSDAQNAPASAKAKWVESGRMPKANAQREGAGADRPQLVVLPNCGVPLSDIRGHDLFVLDLASGRILALRAVKNKDEFLQRIETQDEGDILYYYDLAEDKGKITFLRSADLGWKAMQIVVTYGAITLAIPPTGAPLHVTTRGGGRFQVRIIREDKNGCAIEFSPLKAAAATFQAMLPNGVTVELLGVCDFPSEGKQWWRPDGALLAEAPYDRRGGWITPDDRNKAPFELALLVRDLPEDWEAGVNTPGNSYSTADPPYKAGRRLPDLRWLVMEADPNQTTCAIRCNLAAPWQTVATSPPLVGPSPQTAGDGVVFSEIRAGFGGGRVTVSGRDSSAEGVSVTVTGRVGGRDKGRLIGVGDLRRMIAVTKDGKTHVAPPDGFFFAEAVGKATAYFWRVALADIKEFQYQTRVLTQVDFRNIPLRRGLKTDVQIRVSSDDTDRQAVSAPGTDQEKEIVLPDVDHMPGMLDLAAAKFVPVPTGSPEEIARTLEKSGQGDLVYDSPLLLLVRGANSPQAHPGPVAPFQTYEIKRPLPADLIVTTAEGRQYKITIFATSEKSCLLRYSLISTDRGAGGGALVRPGATEPKEGSGEFDELSVKFSGMWIWWQKPEFAIQGDGSVTFSVSRGPRDATRYQTEFRLRPEHLDQLTALLRATGWLTAKGANEEPGYTDATRIDIHLTRGSESRSVWCHDRNPQPYRSLVHFLQCLQRQEYLLSRTVVGEAQERLSAFREIDQDLRSAEGEPVAAPNFAILDYDRFVPTCLEVIHHTDKNHHDIITAALKLLARRQVEQARQKITELTAAAQTGLGEVAPTVRTEYVGTAAVQALAALGGEQARARIRAMAQDHRRWPWGVNNALVEAVLAFEGANGAALLRDMLVSNQNAGWGLIRLGPQGVPAIVSLLQERPTLPDWERIDQIHVIRQYIEHWQEVPQPVDQRVLEAVRENLDYRLGHSRDWTEYHRQLLQLAGVPEPRSKNPIQIAGEFLQAVQSDNDASIDALATPSSTDWPNRLDQLKQLPNLKSLQVSAAYVDRPDNLALIIASGSQPSEGPSAHVVLHLNFISGAVWRVGTIAVQTAEQTERRIRQFRQNHPDAIIESNDDSGVGTAARSSPAAPTSSGIPSDKGAGGGALAAPGQGIPVPHTPRTTGPVRTPRELSGRVIDPNGRPVAGAQVALCTKDKGVIIEVGQLVPTTAGGRSSEIVNTDAQGRFAFSSQPPEFHLIAAHDQGFVWVTDKEWAAAADVRLAPWARIEGTLHIGREPGVGQRVSLLNFINKNAIDQGVHFEYRVETDAEGRFAFVRVPPTWMEVGYMIRVGDSMWTDTSRTPIHLQPGQSLQMPLGGEGRPVVGRFVPPAGYQGPVYFGAGLRAFATQRPDLPRPAGYDRMTQRERQEWLQQWLKTPEAEAFYDARWHDLNRRHYAFRIEEDGSFRIEDVIPGKYNFTVWLEERFRGPGRPEEIGGYYGTAEVPPLAQAYTDEPLALGDLMLKMRNPPLHVGDPAPLFEAKTLDGKDIRLVDYRGKFVLLSFWQPTFHPELARLRELQQTHDANRLAIIDFAVSDTVQEVERYIREHQIEWPQVYLGEHKDNEIAKQYGDPVASYILLVDPEGKILATWLRGEKLTEAVEKAIPKP